MKDSARRATTFFASSKVASDAGLGDNYTREEAATAVRDFVYRKTTVGTEDTSLPPWERYIRTASGEITQVCSGMAATYDFALQSLGIPSRIVRLGAESFVSGNRLGDTHATVEAFLDGKWAVMDPTFNASFSCSSGGDMLSIKEMRDCAIGGGDLVPVYGKTIVKGRSVEEYYLPYQDLLFAYEIEATQADGTSFPLEEYPEAGWFQRAEARYQ